MKSQPTSLLAALLLALGLGLAYQAASAEPLGTMFVSRQHPEWAPLPGNVLGLPLRSLGSNGYAEVFEIQDQDINYDELQAAESSSLALGAQRATLEGGGPLAAEYGPDDLYLEISVSNDYAHLTLHGTVDTNYYQLLSKTNVNQPGDWRLGEIVPGASGTNWTAFSPVFTGTAPTKFFRAQRSRYYVRVDAGQKAIEPDLPNDPGQTGQFYISAVVVPGETNPVTVTYSMGGSADKGVDYTDIANQVTLSTTNSWSAEIDIVPIQDYLVEFDETVSLTLVPSADYLIDPSGPSATITLSDASTDIFVPVLYIYHPIAIDYHAPSNSLIVSYNYPGPGTNFARVYTNAGVTVAETWSGIADLEEEVKLATVKATAGGFTNGDMYFGNDTDVGWVSADGTRSNLNWCILTNETFVNPLKLRGSLYVDRTGTFSNNLVVVTSDEHNEFGDKGIWLVESNGQPTLLASIYTRHLEGAIAVTNDVQRWGPWAGKILTGDEAAKDQTGVLRPLIYTVDTNGAVASYALGVHPEDFDLVPPDQDLYCVNFRSDGGRILKLSRTLLTDYVGDLLITDAGEDYPSYIAKLALVRWDSTNANFVVRTILLPDSSLDNHFEHVTFAPIDLPPLIP